jgi:hypothetical protein
MKNRTEFIRVEKKSNFTIVSNGIIKSSDFTADESILLIYLLHLPSTWKIYKSKIQKLFKDKQMTKSRFEKSWKGLIEKGHLIRSRNRGESGQFNSWSYTIVESPSTEVSKTDMSVNQTSVNRVVSKPTSRRMGDIINTNKESTIKENTNREIKDLENINNILGGLSEDNKLVVKESFDYMKRNHPNYPQLLNFHSPEELQELIKSVPKHVYEDVVQYLMRISIITSTSSN